MDNTTTQEMFDFIRIEKIINPAELILKDLVHYETSTDGEKFYKLRSMMVGVKPLSTSKAKLTIEGSLPYYMQDHNLNSFLDLERLTIEFMENMIGIYLSDATVKAVEYAVVVKSKHDLQRMLKSHKNLDGFTKSLYFKRNNTITDIVYEKDNAVLRLSIPWGNFNRGNNLPQETLRELYSNGYNKNANWIRFALLNKNLNELFTTEISVEKMIKSEFRKIHQNILLKHYRNIDKESFIRFKKNEGVVNTENILMIDSLNNGYYVMEEVDDFMNSSMMPHDNCSTGNPIREEANKLYFEKYDYSIEKQVREAFDDSDTRNFL